jgi:hypothetical protein
MRAFFDDNKRLIPVFNSCLGQSEGVTKVLLADLGSGFIPRGEHDSYQKGTFILGPGGRGKSEFQKIVRVIHGANCITPCQNTLGQKFSHGQFAGSLAVAYLPDEIHKKCGLSQQMLYNFIDQTPIRCEIKFKQQLVTLPFQLYICWVANAFFSDYELSEALLRRSTVFDVNFFTFMKFAQTPSSLVEKTEVCYLPASGSSQGCFLSKNCPTDSLSRPNLSTLSSRFYPNFLRHSTQALRRSL